jgi:hypothetical protein
MLRGTRAWKMQVDPLLSSHQEFEFTACGAMSCGLIRANSERLAAASGIRDGKPLMIDEDVHEGSESE